MKRLICIKIFILTVFINIFYAPNLYSQQFDKDIIKTIENDLENLNLNIILCDSLIHLSQKPTLEELLNYIKKKDS